MSLNKDRVHEYELQPKGLTTTMVNADGSTRNVIGPTSMYERRPSWNGISEEVLESIQRRSNRSRSGTPARSVHSMILPSASTGNIHTSFHRAPIRLPPKPLPPKPSYIPSYTPSYNPSQNPVNGRTTTRISSLPPLPPRPIKHHYPLPPPSFPEAMVSVSKRLRNRSVSPTPQYAQLQLGSRPGLVNAALGRESPSLDAMRSMYSGPNYVRNI